MIIPSHSTFLHSSSMYYLFCYQGIIKGTFYYNHEADLTGEYTYSVTSTTDSDKKVFCTIKGQKEKTVDDTVKHYYWKVGSRLPSLSLFLTPIILFHSLLPLMPCVYSRSYSVGFLLKNCFISSAKMSSAKRMMWYVLLYLTWLIKIESLTFTQETLKKDFSNTDEWMQV